MNRHLPMCWTNSSYANADFVIIGIPDESRSHSKRKGASLAPYKVREVSWQRDVYMENGITSLAYPYNETLNRKIYDCGDVPREETGNAIRKIVSDGKIPITIGGDHSVTTQIVKALSTKTSDAVSLVYFDAHPDFLSSTTDFYGSVIYDILPYIDVKKSIQIGIRSPEKEEIDNISKYQLKVITPFDIERLGIRQTASIIFETIGPNPYISLDMDCIDPAFAPGVSVPVPLGVNSTTVSQLIAHIASHGLAGMDIVEICPPFDQNDVTAHLASRIIAETVYSCKIRKQMNKENKIIQT